MFDKMPQAQEDLEPMPAVNAIGGDGDELDAQALFASVEDLPEFYQEGPDSDGSSTEFSTGDFVQDSEDEFVLEEVCVSQFFYQDVEMLECLCNDGNWYLKCSICDFFIALIDYHDQPHRENCCKELNGHIQILHGGKTAQDMDSSDSE